MSLTERLAAAARERGEAAPLPPPPPPEPEPPEPVDVRSVIVGPSQPVTAVEPGPDADPEAVCPTCGRTGTIAIVDLARRATDWACDGCATMWRVAMPVPERHAVDA
jgi:hypothetical protein